MNGLQKSSSEFVFERFSVRHDPSSQSLTIQPEFVVESYHFSPSLVITSVARERYERSKDTIETLAFHYCLSEMLSYWKAFCSPTVRIAAGTLTKEQILFWEKLFRNGLGEFFFVNKIKPFAPRFESSGKTFASLDLLSHPATPRVLVPIGGGKDSIVTLETLSQYKEKNECELYTLSSGQSSSQRVIETYERLHGLDGQVSLTRTIDPELLELNAKGYPNGHTPFSSVIAFSSLIVAALFDCDQIALSNERSANEATVEWQGIDINHQYSKSYTFEKDFRKYTDGLGSVAAYFSILRPLYELQIVSNFCTHPEYFSAFASCNVGQKQDRWCGVCGKCVFVGLMLAAFLPLEEVNSIFGQEMFSESQQTEEIGKLIGLVSAKPFECVGTRQESQAALYLTIQNCIKENQALPIALEQYREYVGSNEAELEKQAKQILSSFDENNFVPKPYLSLIRGFL